MDIRQQCLCWVKPFSYIGAYMTNLCKDHKERIEYLSAEQLPDDHVAINQDSILLPFVHDLQHNRGHHPSDDDCSEAELDSKNACIDREQPPAQTLIHGTPHSDNRLGGKCIDKKSFEIFDTGIDLWTALSCEEEYRLAHWRAKHNLSRAAIIEHSRNPALATVGNFTSTHTVFERFMKMYHVMRIDSCKLGNYVTIIWLIQTTFAMMITRVSFTAILLIA